MKSGFGLLLAASGLIVWASAFVILYALLSLGCRYGWQQGEFAGLNLLTLLLALVWALHLAAIAGLGWYGTLEWRRIRASGETGPVLYVAFLTGAIALVSLVGTAYLGAPVLVLPPCA